MDHIYEHIHVLHGPVIRVREKRTLRDVKYDMGRMGIRGCNAQKTDEWRNIVEEVKGHIGL